MEEITALTQTGMVTDSDQTKLEALHLLVSPLEVLANWFMAYFDKYEPILVQVDPLEGFFGLLFMKHVPTSDALREIVFLLYKRQWGHKPDELDVVYKAARANTGACMPPVILNVTVKPENLQHLLRTAKGWQLEEWINNLPPTYWSPSRPHPKHLVVLKENKQKRTQSITVFENGLSGEEAPVVRCGLFRL